MSLLTPRLGHLECVYTGLRCWGGSLTPPRWPGGLTELTPGVPGIGQLPRQTGNESLPPGAQRGPLISQITKSSGCQDSSRIASLALRKKVAS